MFGTERLLARIKAWPLWLKALAGAVAILVAWEIVMSDRPRADRKWVEHLAWMPSVEMREDGFSFGPATDWSYNAEGPVEKSFTTSSESFADLRNAWFVVEPHPGMKPMAHTLILFEFANDRIIGLTVEARREEHEKYSAWWGLFNKFELAYVWSTARDLLGRRAVFLQHDVLVFPLELTAEQKVAFLKSVLAKTQSVVASPRFYNTLVSNCTNELAKAAGLGWHSSWILTGYSPERLYDLKLIPGDGIEAARASALMTNEVRSWAGMSSADFDRALLAELRQRHGVARLEAAKE